jgi:hypothetical protein
LVRTNYNSIPHDEPFCLLPLNIQSNATILPTSQEELEGDVDPVDPQMRSLADTLNLPVGTITFWSAEFQPNGQPNFIALSAGPNKQLFVDPIGHTVNFRMLSNGVVYQLQRSFSVPKSGKHFIGASWDQAGNVSLCVDGCE